MIDQYGLPVTKSGDGGDSAAIIGTLMTVDDNYDTPANIVMYTNDATPVRHPDTDKWYGRPWRFSRDQLIALLCGCINRQKNELATYVGKKLFDFHVDRWLLSAWNTIRNFQYPTESEHKLKSTPDVKWNPEPKTPDFTGPEVWGLWIRFWRTYPLYPLLLIFDLETLVGSILWRVKPRNDITRNHMLVMITQKNCMPTPISWLSLKISNKKDLTDRWWRYCEAVGEENTAARFLAKL